MFLGYIAMKNAVQYIGYWKVDEQVFCYLIIQGLGKRLLTF
jgi:hypothetical protein